ncbi:hypothetical protein BS50DRAFT_580392 [Corynespora cassiicola Philippines]|uniref:Uncharacterized protein n=1 Tax=Corynespora cassiicola Philippines TaxID=1448308 RepID=A0A2T2N0B3_CORCC|nr:hypothetical protein BS50DRAFT_580392 [Corynespora cassiicola Philippines]
MIPPANTDKAFSELNRSTILLLEEENRDLYDECTKLAQENNQAKRAINEFKDEVVADAEQAETLQ